MQTGSGLQYNGSGRQTRMSGRRCNALLVVTGPILGVSETLGVRLRSAAVALTSAARVNSPATATASIRRDDIPDSHSKEVLKNPAILKLIYRHVVAVASSPMLFSTQLVVKP